MNPKVDGSSKQFVIAFKMPVTVCLPHALPPLCPQKMWTKVYLNNIFPWVLRSNQLLSILVQFGDGSLLGLETFTDKVLSERHTGSEQISKKKWVVLMLI